MIAEIETVARQKALQHGGPAGALGGVGNGGVFLADRRLVAGKDRGRRAEDREVHVEKERAIRKKARRAHRRQLVPFGREDHRRDVGDELGREHAREIGAEELGAQASLARASGW